MDIGDLQNASLDRLDFVTEPGRRDDDDAVRRLNDIDFVLSDAHRLDDNHVEPGGIQHVDNVEGRPSEPAERAAGGHAADEHPRVARQFQHADTVAEDGATRKRARGIDGDDADSAAAFAKLLGQRANHRRLAAAGHAGQPDHMRAAGMAVQLSQRPLAGGGVRFGKRHHPSDALTLAGPHLGDERIGAGIKRWRASAASAIRDLRRRSGREIIGGKRDIAGSQLGHRSPVLIG